MMGLYEKAQALVQAIPEELLESVQYCTGLRIRALRSNITPEEVNQAHVCKDCQQDSSYFWLKDEIWKEVAPEEEEYKKTKPMLLKHYVLCIYCAEKRLGRKLVLNDFDLEMPINDIIKWALIR